MSRTRKTLVIITGTILLLIVLFFIVLATFDWNRLKPTINQKVSAELNRPFAIRGDLGVVWERQPDERGWRSWIPSTRAGRRTWGSAGTGSATWRWNAVTWPRRTRRSRSTGPSSSG